MPRTGISPFPRPQEGFSHLLGAEQDVGRADNEPPSPRQGGGVTPLLLQLGVSKQNLDKAETGSGRR